MDPIFPVEIENEILLHAATERLKFKLDSINVDYNNFVSYLKRFNAFVMGSFPLSCFDNSFEPNDIDIFIIMQEYHGCREAYYEFPAIFKEPCKELLIEKQPLSNGDKQTEYKYIICADGVKFDITICTPLVIDNREDCSSFKFTPNGWVIPNYVRNNILNFINTKRSPEISSFVAFCEIYNPWEFSLMDCVTAVIKKYYFTKDERLCENQEFQKYVKFYPSESSFLHIYTDKYDFDKKRWNYITPEPHCIKEVKPIVSNYGITHSPSPDFG